MANCPDCGHDNPVGVLLCEDCGADLYDGFLEQVATKVLKYNETRELDLRMTEPSSNPIVIYVRQDEVPIAVERSGPLVMGRTDIDAETQFSNVDIDLEPYEAQEHGVSRQHARLDAHLNPPMVTDLDSYNGTFINSARIVPQQPQPLKSGDELRLGHLKLRIYYK